MLAEDAALAADLGCGCAVLFGDLRDMLGCVYQRLDAGGWFVSSLEELLPDKEGALPGNGDWALRRQGRYAHALHYVEKSHVEAGFAGRTLERQTLRYEADAPVAGILAVLEQAREAEDGSRPTAPRRCGRRACVAG